MTSNEYGRETHWQIVRTDAAQPWHARLVSNYRTIMVSENYTRRRSALRAIELASPEWLASKTPLEVDERDPNRCECGHPWAKHEKPGCLVYLGGDAQFCDCEATTATVTYDTEGNSTNGPEPVVVDG